MHVLGHSFSQRRKTPKPRDLHIRKVSFSGSSLSSGCSLSSSSSSSAASTSTARAPLSSRSPTASFDPLSLHPTFHAPPRLHDRPLLSPERRRFEAEATFFDDDESDDGYFAGAGEYGSETKDAMPPHASPLDHTDHDRTEPQDYFFQQILKRPQLPRSRWSESTVHTLEELTPAASIMTPDGDDNDGSDDGGYTFQQASHQSMPNFSHKRMSGLPKRPPMKTLDSLDEFVKRGGWKRRGIVFNEEDMGGDGGVF